MAGFIETSGLIVGAAIASGTPVLYAGTGEILAERAGVVNLGLEGSMLMGAVSAAWFYSRSNSLLLAVAAGAAAGAALGLAHAILVMQTKVGMLASGICIFFIGRGLSAFWGYRLAGAQLCAQGCGGLRPFKILLLDRLPLLGEALFSHDLLTYLAGLVALAAWYLLFHTRAGLLLRAIGEDTEVARGQGVPTRAVKVLAVTTGAGLAGIGGAHIVLGFSHAWLEGVTAGRGWVAIGLVVLARWNPLYLVPVAYLFGGVIAIQLNAQAAGLGVSPYLLSMLPYILTIAALAAARAWVRGPGMPAELARAGH